ncbi:MAG TPA: hypothetical protein PLD84_03165, partial [Chitinophagales bacterium]|nr:hypothetical protein [Chitinophagales bacterium]
MKVLFTLSILIFFTHSLFSQTTLVGHLGGYDSEIPNAMITDHSGNIIICGVFDDVIDFDMSAGVFQLTSINFYDGFIAKYNASGGLIWAKQFGTFITSVEVDESDNIYALGSLEGTKDVDPSSATFNLTSNGLHDGALIKLDQSGNLISAKKIGGIDEDGFTSIKANDSGAIYVTGSFMNTVDFDPSGAVFNLTPSNMGTFYFCNTGFIAKYDYNFNFIWAKRIASSGLLTLHKSDPDHEYFLLSTAGVSAMSTDSADFDPSPTNFISPVPDPLPEAHWMGHIKYNADGEYVWSKFYRTFGSLGGSSLGIYDVEMDADQNIYFTGSFI